MLIDGKLVATGDYDLALDIEKNGYNKYIDMSNVIVKE